jgi:hypothetical protein
MYFHALLERHFRKGLTPPPKAFEFYADNYEWPESDDLHTIPVHATYVTLIWDITK